MRTSPPCGHSLRASPCFRLAESRAGSVFSLILQRSVSQFSFTAAPSVAVSVEYGGGTAARACVGFRGGTELRNTAEASE